MKKSVVSMLLAILMLLQLLCVFPFSVGADDVYIDLTTVPLKSQKVGWGSLGINKDLNGGAVDIMGESSVKTYDKGFVAHASSALEFDISAYDVRMFTADIGIDRNSANQATSSSSVKFLVYADGKLLYTSPVQYYDSPAISLTIGIPAGTKVLKLVTDEDGSNSGDHSAWAIPRLYADASVLEKLASVDASVEKNVYKVGETVAVNTQCFNLGGAEMTPAAIEFSSSDESIATVNAEGLVTGLHAGTVRITVKATDGDKSAEKVVSISFMDEVEEKFFPISSPSGNLMLTAKYDENGSVSYSVVNNEGLSVLGQSFIGFNTELCDFSGAMVFVKQIPVSEFDSTYTNISGKKSTVRDHYNQTVLVFEKDVFYFDVYFRVYDDGFAYRFAVRSKTGAANELPVIGETGTFLIPAKSQVYAEFITNVTSSFCYETGYNGMPVERAQSNNSKYLCYPMLVNVAGEDGKLTSKYMLLSESDLYSDCYYGSVLTVNGDNVFGMTAAPRQKTTEPTVVTTDFASPWRFGIYGELSDIVESDLTENLAPEPEGDFSWVVPGVTAWMWLSEGYEGQRTEATIKDYVDLAAEMGWKYLILDEGWQPNSSRPGRAYDGYFKWFDKLIDYAAEKGVGFIAWVKYVDLDTPEEREILREWAAKGIKGIKADFFDSEDQDTLEGFKAIYELCAECHLIVNCHGAGKPTGERRTYPNVINREAVNGEEYGGFWVNEAVVWAFTRGVIGPVDITPRLFPGSTGNGIGAQLACNVIFESGIPCMASDSEDYRNFNGISFYKDLPAAWDDTKLISGKVGNNVSIARRSGDVWYAAALTYSQKKNHAISLSFLGEGEYLAEIYTSNTAKTVTIEKKVVTSSTTLRVNLERQDGCVIKLTPLGSASSLADVPFSPAELLVWALT